MMRPILTLCVVVAGSGCSFYLNSIPAHRVHPSARQPRAERLERVNLTMLQLPQGQPYLLQAGDVVAVNAPLFPNERQEPVPIAIPDKTMPRLRPATGYPFVVTAAGVIQLPGFPPVSVAGATLEEAQERVRAAIVGKLNQDDLTLAMVLPRTKSILVIREDAVPANGSAALVAGTEAIGTRYRGRVFDLNLEPTESDVLNAMVQSGGLPGLDAKNELVILRRRFETDEEKAALLSKLEDSSNVAETTAKDGTITEVIPLRVPAGTLPRQYNVALRPGDIVLIENRRGQVYYIGGAFLTGELPLPRDKPLDVLQAVAIAGGTQSGLDYGAGGLSRVASVGDATSLVPPTWVILVREYEDRQVSFKIDLKRALWDPRHRVIVRPGDYLHLAYKPSELAANISLKNLGSHASFALQKTLGR